MNMNRASVGWIASAVLHKLREGPGPSLRALSRGAFELLPAGARRALLALRHPRHVRSRARRLPPPRAAAPQVADLVSVVLPVHEQAGHLAAAIDSVLAQTWQSLELIVVDDGSGPGVDAVLQRHAGDPRVRRLRQDHGGLPSALNSGFAVASGEFWCWTSADNTMRPAQLEQLVHFLRRRPETAMVYADYELVDAADRPVRGTAFRLAFRRGPDDAHVRLPRDTAALAVVQDNFVGACFCHHGTVGRLLGGYRDDAGLEDYDHWLRLDRSFRIEHLGRDAPLYRYRLHADSLTARGRELQIERRARRLLAHHRRRSAWSAVPLRFAAVGTAAEWLRRLLGPRERIVPVAAPGAAPGKTLAVADAASLQESDLRALAGGGPAAVWFDTMDDVYRAHAVLDLDHVLAFAADGALAARLAIFTRRVFLGGRDRDALALAGVFAADRTFAPRAEDGAPLAGTPARPAPGSRPRRVVVAAGGLAAPGRSRLVADLAAAFVGNGAQVALASSGRIPDALADAALDPGGDAVIAVGGAAAARAAAVRAAAAGVPCVQILDLAGTRAAAGAAASLATSPAVLAAADRAGQLDAGRAVLLHEGVRPDQQAAAVLHLFAWLRQGGAPAAARAWFRPWAPGRGPG